MYKFLEVNKLVTATKSQQPASFCGNIHKWTSQICKKLESLQCVKQELIR